MKVLNSENIIISRFKFRFDLKAKGYRDKLFVCTCCFSRIPVFYKKLPTCVKKPCPFCNADFYIYNDPATYMLKKHIPRYLNVPDLEHSIQTLIKVLKSTDHIKEATYEITNDFVKVNYDGKYVKVMR